MDVGHGPGTTRAHSDSRDPNSNSNPVDGLVVFLFGFAAVRTCNRKGSTHYPPNARELMLPGCVTSERLHSVDYQQFISEMRCFLYSMVKLLVHAVRGLILIRSSFILGVQVEEECC